MSRYSSVTKFSKTLLLAAAATALFLSCRLLAGELPALHAARAGDAPAKEESIYDRLWRIPVLYSNEHAAFIQEFRFVGRLNLDYYNLDSDLGADQDWVVRRLRVGTKVKFLHQFLLHVEVDLQPQTPDPLYNRLTDAQLVWMPHEAFHLSLGKLQVQWGLDGSTSSNQLLTLERSNLSNNLWFPTQYASGVNISGQAHGWQWATGLYSGGTESPEFGNFDAGTFSVSNLGYDFGPRLGVKKALLRADYVYNQPNPESNVTRPFEHIASLVFQLDATKWGVSAEATGGLGFGTQSDAAGALLMPWIMLSDRLQLVARGTYIASRDPRGLRFNRYENVLATGRGNEYRELYVGLNYYLYGHKLKLQTGWQYVDMQDSTNTGGAYSGWSWVSGLRVYF